LAWLQILRSDAERDGRSSLREAGYTLDEVKHVLDSEEYPANMRAFKSELASLETVGGISQRVFSQYDYDGAYADVLFDDDPVCPQRDDVDTKVISSGSSNAASRTEAPTRSTRAPV